jgi:methanogenic corrinoid protein MtbC1
MFAGQQVHAFQQDPSDRTPGSAQKFGSRLPEVSVASLAKEVLLRVATRVPHDCRTQPAEEEIETLCDLLVSADDEAGLHYISDLRLRGTGIEAIYVDYLSAAAERMGARWVDGRTSFVDVTIGAGRICTILRMLGPSFVPPHAPSRKSAVFAAVPGETHTLGVRMAADLFRNAGWDIDLVIGLEQEDLIRAIKRSDSGLIGLSSGGKHSIPALTDLVAAMRGALADPFILICGHVVFEPAGVIASLGADRVVPDVGTAMAEFEKAWNNLSTARVLA